MSNLNPSSNFSADISNYIQKKVQPLVQRQLVAYQFGDNLRLPKNRGTTYTASRYDRVALPRAPVAEGVPPVGKQLTLVQVSATAQQWGDLVQVTDIGDMTIEHPLFKVAINLVAMQQKETVERNTFNALMAGTQINYAGSVGSRAALGASNVMTSKEVNRMVGALRTIGAPEYLGPMEEDVQLTAGKPSKASSSPAGMEHYVGIMHPLVEQDMRQDTTFVTATSYSDINRLYNNELGEWAGVRFTRSNMVPYFIGASVVTGSAVLSGGALADGTYYITVTESDPITRYETVIHQKSTGIVVSGGSGAASLSVTLPAANYLGPNSTPTAFNVYISTTSSTSPLNLGLSTSGPTTGILQGQAVDLTQSTTVVITGLGLAQTPPAAPTTGDTVYPTFVIGRNAYGIVALDDVKFFYLDKADKLDPLNQLRTVSWKIMYGTIILNQNFFGRIEACSAFSATFG